LKTDVRANGLVRIADKVYLDYHLMIALRWCAAEKFPIQFHSGYGDPDVDLRTGSPIQMRQVLQNDELRDAPIIFLHAGYPFVREVSLLAGVYPNVYLDLGLAIPFAATDFDEIVRQSLVLAPTSRVLWSSDGFAVPEHCWFAAVQGRAALGRELDRLITAGSIGDADALDIADQILRRNAVDLYRLATPGERP
jgi:predicted TIM-barrel fold metal-dependent hydrolase